MPSALLDLPVVGKWDASDGGKDQASFSIEPSKGGLEVREIDRTGARASRPLGFLMSAGSDAIFVAVGDGPRMTATPAASPGVWSLEFGRAGRQLARGEAKVDANLRHLSGFLESLEEVKTSTGARREVVRFEIAMSADRREVTVRTSTEKENTMVFVRQEPLPTPRK
jgi:hypothetical protein